MEEWYNGAPTRPDEARLSSNLVSYRLGPPRLRQIRVRPGQWENDADFKRNCKWHVAEVGVDKHLFENENTNTNKGFYWRKSDMGAKSTPFSDGLLKNPIECSYWTEILAQTLAQIQAWTLAQTLAWMENPITESEW